MFVNGQRWISETEPELGLGVVAAVGDRDVCIQFSAGEEVRQYAAESAPLRRVAFVAGDQIETTDGDTIVIDSVIDTDGVLTYVAGDRQVAETELSDRISFNQPLERLRNAQVHEPPLFDLRANALHWRCMNRQSSVRGFVGGRISLIPHQIYIAHEVTGRTIPRVLLADEVGLGKTIEAGLIVHRLCLSGLASRVLVLVPDSLLHQWFLEFYRRFNMWFSLYDVERCQAAMAGAPSGNPFLDQQLVLCGVEFLANHEQFRALAIEAGWDVIVVDEAHHLRWTPDVSSPEYDLVEALGRDTAGLLLLTATPEQMGHAGHFARLRLLDPDRYPEFERFEKEITQFGDVASAAGRLATGSELSAKDHAHITSVFPEDKDHAEALLLTAATDDSARGQLLDEMLDRHGPGRVMFRNTRHTIKGFPKRVLKLHTIDAPEDIDSLQAEFAAQRSASSRTEDTQPGSTTLRSDDTQSSPKRSKKKSQKSKIGWLVELLQTLGSEKILLICHAREQAVAIDEALQKRMNVKSALFHEGLELIVRDRNASWFAEPEGVRILICSEIGSEGRNFQFAHHLVLFDLPLDPELLEQRIGRLDRIGQTEEIKIHVPVVAGSPQQRIADWYDRGLDAFSGPTTDAELCIERFGDQLHTLAAAPVAESAKSWPALIHQTRAYHDELCKRAAAGRDHLLELSSFRKDVAQDLVHKITETDRDHSLEHFMTDVFEWYGVTQEESAPRSYVLSCEDLYTEGIPGLSDEGAMVTFSRDRALSHENYSFLTSDHPMVTGAIDLLLGSERGNSCIAKLESPEKAVLLEAVFVLECTAPVRLHADRFLAPTPIRIVVDHNLADRSAQFTSDTLKGRLTDGKSSGLLERRELTHTLIPSMHDHSETLADQQSETIRSAAIETMHATLDREIDRLQALRRINDHVRDDEITELVTQRDELEHHLTAATARLDCVRVIWVTP